MFSSTVKCLGVTDVYHDWPHYRLEDLSFYPFPLAIWHTRLLYYLPIHLPVWILWLTILYNHPCSVMTESKYLKTFGFHPCNLVSASLPSPPNQTYCVLCLLMLTPPLLVSNCLVFSPHSLCSPSLWKSAEGDFFVSIPETDSYCIPTVSANISIIQTLHVQLVDVPSYISIVSPTYFSHTPLSEMCVCMCLCREKERGVRVSYVNWNFDNRKRFSSNSWSTLRVCHTFCIKTFCTFAYKCQIYINYIIILNWKLILRLKLINHFCYPPVR